jgi:hypothetical protein
MRLSDRKSRLTFITNSTARYRGKDREIVIEVFPITQPFDYSARGRARRHPGARSSMWRQRYTPGASGSAGKRKGRYRHELPG